MSIKPKKKISVLGIGSAFAFLSLVALVFYFYLYLSKNVDSKSARISQTSENNTPEKFIVNDWEEYVNSDFGYKIQHPPLLTKAEYKDEGGYKNFVRFEETEHSLGKGIAVGVSVSSLSDEVERLKKDMEKFEDAKLVREEKLSLTKYDGFILEYEIENSTGKESRAIIFINKDNYVYSISTVPEQMQKVLSGFSFL
ncbi:hypothetical protein A2962_01705 [Candidatus Woesebacteria bacterium RIFCSPLOWO2_01_FULL_39_61]|uniref:PsbP C-terminal domain-containing protein n=1 Tax=Candidatus Woesebacteria bacterium RIFCSPHIGHO2_02_FULL_39_13 TaxID=1802505 RepID=A0A1F7Z603_9BACT|nr:MAG: hypothetical protein A2692_01945 [Candidatus Woesebacteria bacterium RIFCSPHIGHO2_01_FULL_39_95]OGM34559.1 MAG: hypothetical protein A3D01_03395 [Candidatus Woesebacteria bacterium RIFCSPHIGHO2_02_FULL_39_13]OGM38826.1 MAG: hypothetical protein A3E13_01290 [Candidatus Woesebacteria bacterium RIFCSPHIGHO2_12_FULL_40_20]OGM65832.1 MAG: hypothetical protein A2962_01705 [Candidatus Woesebacteria bacterium RIFCSPLOWO2_01_FULL_39_61]OGM71646.1 MAG: hypothetical protein A3H19_05010 [Candidatus